jgi:Fe-S oxidoreductase
MGGFQVESLDAHQIAQLVRWIVFAGMTAAALIMFGVVVSRRVGYIRLGRSAQDGDGRAAGSRHDPEAEEEDDEQFLHLSAAASYPKRSKDAGARRILQSVQTFEFRRALGWAVHVFGHRKLLKDIRSGLLHLVLFYGFIVLQFGAADIIWRGLSGRSLPLPAYHTFIRIQEMTVVLVLLAIIYAAIRRYVEKLARLKRGWKPSIVLWFIGGLMVTVLFTQAFDQLKEGSITVPVKTETAIVQKGLSSPIFLQSSTAAGRAAALQLGGSSPFTARVTQLPAILSASDLLYRFANYKLQLVTDHAATATSTAADSLYLSYAPFSSGIAEGMRTIGVSETVAGAGYEIFWWLHAAILLAFLVYVPQSKHFHIFTAPVNLWLRRRSPPGKLAPLDLEDENAESFGVGAIEQFTQKQLLDLYACVECGRCTNVCPASNTGKLLSPMHLIMKLRDHLTEKGAAITSRSPWVPSFAAASSGQTQGSAHVMGGAMPVWVNHHNHEDAENQGEQTSIEPTMTAQKHAWHVQKDTSIHDTALIGDVMTESELWACTTCRSCEEQCPVGNEHVDKIIDMRRYLVLTEGRLPAEGQRALQNIERQGNPWGLPRAERAAWLSAYETSTAGYRSDVQAKPIRTVQEAERLGEKPELLLWAGTMGTYDQRSRRVLFALVRLLQQAGVPFAVLGGEERNSGDTARRMGNELLFQTLCAENIATLQRYGIRRIVTICPHTFNALKNEYPDFGLDRSVVTVEHHTTLLDRLVAEGKLLPIHRVEERVVYHDSCYLGRYNGIYDAPRNLLQSIPGIKLLEMERSRQNGMCCGAGGGLMWMEERSGMRVNEARVSQALAVAPTVIGSACPYCLTMMEDGVKLHEAEAAVRARDVAELLAESVFGRNESALQEKE